MYAGQPEAAIPHVVRAYVSILATIINPVSIGFWDRAISCWGTSIKLSIFCNERAPKIRGTGTFMQGSQERWASPGISKKPRRRWAPSLGINHIVGDAWEPYLEH